MRRVVLILCAVMGMSCLCFAEQAVNTVTPVVKQQPGKTNAVKPSVVTGIFTGTFDSAVKGDPQKGTKTEFVCVDVKGVKTTFTATPATVVIDKDEKSPAIDKITKGDKVTVKFITTKEGVKEAVLVASQE